ncbi:30S ribosomal protein S21 [Patescibacteria group bacterium]|nr:MAG: 30S ribosomal protein S21 [Patescibacteria group bacterium]
MVDVKRRKGESFEGLFRRFTRRVQQSGRLLEARKHRFHEPEQSKNSLHRSALRRKDKREAREYLVKTGKLIEEERKGPRRR